MIYTGINEAEMADVEQIQILKVIKPKDARICVYDDEQDGLTGAFLLYRINEGTFGAPDYEVGVDIEDVRTLEEFHDRQTLQVAIKSYGAYVARGYVWTMYEVSEIVAHLRANDLKSALEVLYRRRPGVIDGVRSADEVNALIKVILDGGTCQNFADAGVDPRVVEMRW